VLEAKCGRNVPTNRLTLQTVTFPSLANQIPRAACSSFEWLSPLTQTIFHAHQAPMSSTFLVSRNLMHWFSRPLFEQSGGDEFQFVTGLVKKENMRPAVLLF
jgi:hypothetical protein